MKLRTTGWVSLVSVTLLVLGYATLGGTPGWLDAVEAGLAAAAGVNHPVMFVEAPGAARMFNLFAIAAGLALRVFLFASVTAWLLRKRLEARRESLPARGRQAARFEAPRSAPDWLEVSRN